MIADTIDQNVFVLDVLVQSRRDFKAARRLLRKLLKQHRRAPHVLITDKLNSYGTARRQPRLGSEHRQYKGLNNHAENSPQPAQQREHQMRRFKSARQMQRFLSIHDPIASLFHLPRTVCPRARTMPPVPLRAGPSLFTPVWRRDPDLPWKQGCPPLNCRSALVDLTVPADVLRAMTRIEAAVVEKTVPDYSRDIARILCRTLLSSCKPWRHSRCCGTRPNRSNSAKPTL